MSLLEREREAAALEGALSQVAAGTGAVVAIEGEPGIGKSELLRAARDLADRRSMNAPHVRASDTERGFGYALVRGLVEGVVRGAGEAHRTGALSGAAGQLLGLLDPSREAPPAELMVAGGFHRLVEDGAAARPLLLSVDDAHWADLPSLRVLLYLARRIEELPAVLCLAARPMPGDEASAPLLDGLVAEAGDRVLQPAPLSPDASAAIVAEELGEAAEAPFCAACHEATGGNPLLLRELIRGLASQSVAPTSRNVEAIPRIGGPAVSRTVRLRLAHLPEAATRLARAAAVLGDGASVAHAAEIADLDPEAAFDAAARLGQVEILTGGSRVQFVHPLVREAVLAELTPAEAGAVHEPAARLLAEQRAPTESVAEHLLRTPPRGSAETARILRAAGNAAAAAGDAQGAIELLGRALDEPAPEADRPMLLLELAAAERNTRVNQARVHADAALELIDDPGERAAAAFQLADLLVPTDPHRAIEMLEPYVELLGDPEDRLRAGAVMLTAAVLAPDQLPRARKLAGALRPELDAGTPAARMATALVGYLEALDNRPASEVMERIEATIAAPVDPPWILGQLVIGMIALIAADSPAALSIAEEWDALAAETGYAGQVASALMCRSHALLARGRLTEALADARAGVEAAELYVGGVAANWPNAALLEALIEVGELDEAERVATRVVPTGAVTWTFDLHGLPGARARLTALRGDRAGALKQTLELGRRCEEAGVRNPALAPWRSRAALLLATQDEAERARELAAEEVELARAWGAPRGLGRALSALALVSAADEALALHEEAVGVLAGSPARLELARASLELGAALRRGGKRSAARGPLRRAVELAEECGAAPLLERASEELVGAGARPRRTARSGPASLTPQERRVAKLAAEGLSNQEVAERLYVSPRTVERHLSNVYRKLEISSRSQLARLLAE